jgi:hypothetical protein
VTVIVDVTTSDDLVALYSTYSSLLAADQPARLEVRFAPGTYGVASIGPIQLDLGNSPSVRQPKIDVVLRGAATTAPTVLRDMSILVRARTLQLENLILTGQLRAALDARVTTGFAMINCIVANNTAGSPWPGDVMLLVASLYGERPLEVTLEDTWFVGNGQQSTATLLAIRPATGSFVERVELSRCGFIGNSTSVDVQVDEARTVHLDQIIATKRVRDGVVLRTARCKDVSVTRSAFYVDDPSAVAEEDTRTWASGIDVRDSQIAADLAGDAWTRSNELVRDLASIVPDSAAVRSRLQAVVGLAR